MTEGYAPRQGVVTRDADEDAVEGIVLMRRGENPSVVLKRLRGSASPSSTRRVLRRRREDQPRSTTAPTSSTPRSRPCSTTCAEGALLVTLVLFVFMLSLRASLIVAIVIPLSLAASFIYLSACAG